MHLPDIFALPTFGTAGGFDFTMSQAYMVPMKRWRLASVQGEVMDADSLWVKHTSNA